MMSAATLLPLTVLGVIRARRTVTLLAVRLQTLSVAPVETFDLKTMRSPMYGSRSALAKRRLCLPAISSALNQVPALSDLAAPRPSSCRAAMSRVPTTMRTTPTGRLWTLRRMAYQTVLCVKRMHFPRHAQMERLFTTVALTAATWTSTNKSRPSH